MHTQTLGAGEGETDMAGSRDDGTFAPNKAHHPNRKVGRYEGSVGRTHMFSYPGGDSSDSLSATDMDAHSFAGVVGQEYEVPTNDSRHIKPIQSQRTVW